MKHNKHIFTLFAISSLHSGSGSSITTIDLEIQREPHTQYPLIRGSSLKGAMREHFFQFSNNNENLDNIFGKEQFENESSLPGAIYIYDAKILSFPARSNFLPYIHITSPFIFQKFLEFISFDENIDIPLTKLKNNEGILLKSDSQNEVKQIILEEINIEKISSISLDKLDKYFEYIDTLLMVSDEVFKYIVTFGMEISTNIKIEENGVTKDGSLRYVEYLPIYSLLYSGIESKNSEYMKELQKYLDKYIIIGGEKTNGKGICKIKWF